MSDKPIFKTLWAERGAKIINLKEEEITQPKSNKKKQARNKGYFKSR